VWTLAADETTSEALRQQAARLPEVERPVVIVGDPSELDYLLSLRGEANVRFDVILGRNVLTAFEPHAFPEIVRVLVAHLLPGGRLIFSQNIPRHTQRLYDLIEWGRNEKLRDKVIAAEESIYADATDPLVDWDERDLQTWIEAAGLSNVRLTVEDQIEERLITASHLDRWFGAGEARPSYRERLLVGGLTEIETNKITNLFRGQLLDQSVSWRSRLAFIQAVRGD
jgi:putative ATPase